MREPLPAAWLIAAEPAPWTAEVQTRSGATRFAPWTTPALAAGVRVWGQGQAARQHAARCVLRAALGQLAARQLPRHVTTVYAPSLVALPVFVQAKTLGMRCVLVEDLPNLRQLHADLAAAALAHPDAAFLHNHRAARHWLVQQEREQVLADVRLASSVWAAGLGPPGRPTEPLVVPQPGLLPMPVPQRPRLLLAGPAMARLGSYEALAAAEALGATLLVRPIDATEPTALLRHRLVQPSVAAERTWLRGVDAVVAPSWVQAHLPEVHRAVALGVPVFATDRAAGWWPEVVQVPQGDVAALVAAIRRHQQDPLP